MTENRGNKIIAVTGATGSQGGGLVGAILDDPDSRFSVRAITRNPASDKGKELTEAGAEVVAADFDDPASLRQAFEGAYGVFCVTNFWEHFSPAKELAQATNLANAASEADVQHAIWSTLEDTRNWVPLDDDRMPTLMEKYKVPHFDAKGEANRAFVKSGVPTTYLLTSFFWENFIYLGSGPQKDANGNYAIAFPMGDKKLPGIASGDIGRCAYGVFRAGADYFGETVGVAGEHLSGNEMAAAFSKTLDIGVQYHDVPADVYRTFDFEGAEDLGNMFQFKKDFNDDFCAARNVERARSLNPSLQTFEEWLERNKESIPL